jgi:hypothetical protein
MFSYYKLMFLDNAMHVLMFRTDGNLCGLYSFNTK